MEGDRELLPLVEHISCHFFKLSICSLKGRGGMDGGIFLIIAILGWAVFFLALLRIWMFPKWVAILSQIEVFSDKCSWSQLALKIVDMKSQADSLKSSSWRMLLPSRPSRLYCLRKHAIHCSKQAILQTSLCKNLLVPDSDVAVKLLSYRLGSASFKPQFSRREWRWLNKSLPCTTWTQIMGKQRNWNF